ncbi:erf superfamily [Caudoviricetes sp.]|nr:erf superfamily [Caudoviricetes sp.]UOF81485.1 erf superfamily [Caudoviricetes sp.]
MSNLATIEAAPVANAQQPISETAAILSVIERAASNPDVDIDKLERLLEMRERVEAQQALKAFAAAFPSLQAAIPEISENGAIDLGRGKPIPYAKWEDINKVIKPILDEHGFSLFFRTKTDGDSVTITAVLRHVMGHTEETSLTLPVDKGGNKNVVHGIGSSTSYGQRYTARALLNISSRLEADRDDCGLAGGGGKGVELVGSEQIIALDKRIKEVGADKDKFLAFLKVTSLTELPESRYHDAMACLDHKAKRAAL